VPVIACTCIFCSIALVYVVKVGIAKKGSVGTSKAALSHGSQAAHEVAAKADYAAQVSADKTTVCCKSCSLFCKPCCHHNLQYLHHHAVDMAKHPEKTANAAKRVLHDGHLIVKNPVAAAHSVKAKATGAATTGVSAACDTVNSAAAFGTTVGAAAFVTGQAAGGLAKSSATAAATAVSIEMTTLSSPEERAKIKENAAATAKRASDRSDHYGIRGEGGG